MLKKEFAAAVPLEAYIEAAATNQELWRAIQRRAAAPEDLVRRVERLPGEWRLLVLTEDWCGDGINSIPPLAALAEAADNLELRILDRDEHPALMDTHLTNGSRSIPVVIVLDGAWSERGWWGPRPAELQAWVLSEGKGMEPDARYREIRRWYARDGGRTTQEEVIDLLERAAAERRAAG